MSSVNRARARTQRALSSAVSSATGCSFVRFTGGIRGTSPEFRLGDELRVFAMTQSTDRVTNELNELRFSGYSQKPTSTSPVVFVEFPFSIFPRSTHKRITSIRALKLSSILSFPIHHWIFDIGSRHGHAQPTISSVRRYRYEDFRGFVSRKKQEREEGVGSSEINQGGSRDETVYNEARSIYVAMLSRTHS